MSGKQVKAIGGGCAGGLIGAVLGIIVGGFLGPIIATSGSGLGRDPHDDPIAKQWGSMFDACGSVFGLLMGVSIGGIIGATGGSVVGAGLATRDSMPPSD